MAFSARYRGRYPSIPLHSLGKGDIMTVTRMDNVGIVVENLDTAI